MCGFFYYFLDFCQGKIWGFSSQKSKEWQHCWLGLQGSEQSYVAVGYSVFLDLLTYTSATPNHHVFVRLN